MTPVDITVTGEDFVSINQEADIPVGTEIQLQTKSNHPVIVQRKDSKPSSEDNNGRVMKGIKNKSSIYQVREGSEEVWLRLDTDNLSYSGKVSAGLIFGGEEPVDNYVARLDGATKYWVFDEQIPFNPGDILQLSFIGATVSGTYRGFIASTNVNLRISSGGNPQIFDVAAVSNPKINDENIVNNVTAIPETGENVLEFSSFSNFSFKGIGARVALDGSAILHINLALYNFRVIRNGVVIHEIPLTNKAQGATQLATVGNINATMINYTGDEWEQLP